MQGLRDSGTIARRLARVLLNKYTCRHVEDLTRSSARVKATCACPESSIPFVWISSAHLIALFSRDKRCLRESFVCRRQIQCDAGSSYFTIIIIIVKFRENIFVSNSVFGVWIRLECSCKFSLNNPLRGHHVGQWIFLTRKNCGGHELIGLSTPCLISFGTVQPNGNRIR